MYKCKFRGPKMLTHADECLHRHTEDCNHTQSPLQMSQHHYHAVLIPARVIHLNSNQNGCDSSLAATLQLSWLVPAVNRLSSVFSRPQMATGCWNLPLKHPVIRNRIPELCVCVCHPALFTSRLKYVPSLQWINSA